MSPSPAISPSDDHNEDRKVEAPTGGARAAAAAHDADDDADDEDRKQKRTKTSHNEDKDGQPNWEESTTRDAFVKRWVSSGDRSAMLGLLRHKDGELA